MRKNSRKICPVRFSDNMHPVSRESAFGSVRLNAGCGKLTLAAGRRLIEA
jgi:hypothetical protein